MRTILTLLVLSFTISLSAQLPNSLDEVAPFSEGLAAIRKGQQWAFIDDLGSIVIDFRNDIYTNPNAKDQFSDVRGVRYPKFNNGLCIVQQMVDDIPVFGFIDTKGELVIEHKFLNVRPFENGLTSGIIYEKVLRGQNEFKLNIYEYKFHEVIMDSNGKIIEFLGRRYNIQMKNTRYKRPNISTKILNDKLVAIKLDNNWEIRKLDM